MSDWDPDETDGDVLKELAGILLVLASTFGVVFYLAGQ